MLLIVSEYIRINLNAPKVIKNIVSIIYLKKSYVLKNIAKKL